MKYGALFLLLISFLSMRLQAITEEPYFYYFKILSKTTNEEIPFVNLKITMNDTVIGTGVTGVNGIGLVKTTKKIKNASLRITFTGYKPLDIIQLTMKIKDTLVYRISESAQQLDGIEIVSYQVPKIDPDKPEKKKFFQKNAAPLPPELIIEYTREELITRQDLLNGIELSDSLISAGTPWTGTWFKSLAQSIKYPDKARDAGIQEKIYFQLSFNSQGRLSQIKLLKGDDPALVLAAFKALSSHAKITIPRGQGALFQFPIMFKLR
jgi:hypothetical protein